MKVIEPLPSNYNQDTLQTLSSMVIHEEVRELEADRAIDLIYNEDTLQIGFKRI